MFLDKTGKTDIFFKKVKITKRCNNVMVLLKNIVITFISVLVFAFF